MLAPDRMPSFSQTHTPSTSNTVPEVNRVTEEVEICPDAVQFRCKAPLYP